MKDENFLDTTIDDWRAEMEQLKPSDPGMTIKYSWNKHAIR